jgi:lipoprotein signal peptidase
MKIARTPLLFIGGVFLLVDRFFKWQAFHTWYQTKLIGRFFGWEPFLNNGIAFGIQIPQLIIIFSTVPILIGVVFLLWREWQKAGERGNNLAWWGLYLVFLGALSNWYDRVVYGSTVDYFRLVTGIINLADVLIVSGFVLYFFSIKKKKKKIV